MHSNDVAKHDNDASELDNSNSDNHINIIIEDFMYICNKASNIHIRT